jgi:hypothetical protein
LMVHHNSLNLRAYSIGSHLIPNTTEHFENIPGSLNPHKLCKSRP